MKIYFTSDCHFGHANIIIYANRPFLGRNDLIPNTNIWVSEKRKEKRCNEMNEEIIKRWNQKVKPEDLVYHLGDFSFKGSNKALEWEGRLNGKIVHIVGNHDYNNGVKTLINVALMQFSNLEVLSQHHPPTIPREIPDYIDLVLCGHVHDHWKHKFIDGIPVINIGQDVWNFTPVSIDSIYKYYNEIIRKKQSNRVKKPKGI